MASSSKPPARGWEWEARTGLFTEAELAAADQLVQLSGSGGGGWDDDDASPSSSSSSVNTAAVARGVEEKEVARAAGGPAGEEELDRRARKRFRLLSDLYAATRPAIGAATDAGARKRKRHAEPDAKAAMARYGDQSYYC